MKTAKFFFPFKAYCCRKLLHMLGIIITSSICNYYDYILGSNLIYILKNFSKINTAVQTYEQFF